VSWVSKTGRVLRNLCCPMSTPLSTSRVGCCAGGFHGGDARAWLLQIVRNTCYTWLEKNRPMELSMEFDEELYMQTCATPETLAIADDDRKCLIRALEMLPPRYREVLVLRELEGCSYKEIAAITSIPVGTVMSSLSRARRQLYSALANSSHKEAVREV
jgi:RNA polymerase sigma-70 factor, ECF subfamily